MLLSEGDMATYTVTSASAGTTLQASAGTLVSIQMTAPPDATRHGNKGGGKDANVGLPTSGYLCLIDQPASGRFHVLVNKEEDNPVFGSRTVVKFNIAFSQLYCQAVPTGATYSVVTA
jgi:hypothetical protein